MYKMKNIAKKVHLKWTSPILRVIIGVGEKINFQYI